MTAAFQEIDLAPLWLLTVILRVNTVASLLCINLSTAVHQIYYESHRAPKKVIQMFIPPCFAQQT